MSMPVIMRMNSFTTKKVVTYDEDCCKAPLLTTSSSSTQLSTMAKAKSFASEPFVVPVAIVHKQKTIDQVSKTTNTTTMPLSTTSKLVLKSFLLKALKVRAGLLSAAAAVTVTPAAATAAATTVTQEVVVVKKLGDMPSFASNETLCTEISAWSSSSLRSFTSSSLSSVTSSITNSEHDDDSSSDRDAEEDDHEAHQLAAAQAFASLEELNLPPKQKLFKSKTLHRVRRQFSKKSHYHSLLHSEEEMEALLPVRVLV